MGLTALKTVEFAVAVLERVYYPVVQVIDKGLTLLRPCSDSSSSRPDSWEMPQLSSSTCSGSGSEVGFCQCSGHFSASVLSDVEAQGGGTLGV